MIRPRPTAEHYSPPQSGRQYALHEKPAYLGLYCWLLPAPAMLAGIVTFNVQQTRAEQI